MRINGSREHTDRVGDAADGRGDAVSRGDGLATGSRQRGAEGVHSVIKARSAADRKRIVPWQDSLTIRAGQMDRARVARRDVVELVQRRHRDAEWNSGSGCARRSNNGEVR